MKIPYGSSNFASIRRKGYFYVDKTPYIPKLEAIDGEFQLFLRPRRFGKSTLMSMLADYYDIAKVAEFDELFGGLWIHSHPTDEKNKYFIFRLDFSPVNSHGTAQEIRKSFAKQIKESIRSFIDRYVQLVPKLAVLEAVVDSAEDDAGGMMTSVLMIVGGANRQVFLFIDEYDHFGNRLLSDGLDETYQQIVQGAGVVRSFYAALKALTTTGSLARMFITGVSPIMLDDLSSGFNIITHVSLDEQLNALAGFTHADVEGALDVLLEDKLKIAEDPRIKSRETLLQTLERFYDGYRFSAYASERVYNSTLVLYFMRQLARTGRYPTQMLDLNVRTDYGRLYLIAKAATGQDRGTRELLEEILTNESISSPLVEQFGTRAKFGRAQLISLFFHLGMLTFGPRAATESMPQLVIPNRVMRELQWEYLLFALQDHDDIRIDMTLVERALQKMAKFGDVQPLVDLFHDQVVKRIGLRELINFDEKTMKLMLFAYLSQSQSFYLMTEKEVTQGYCDLLLALRGNASANKFAWILEAKYVKTDASNETIEKAFQEANGQLERYAADKDLVEMLTLGNQLKTGTIVFVGFKDVQYRAWEKGYPLSPAQ